MGRQASLPNGSLLLDICLVTKQLSAWRRCLIRDLIALTGKPGYLRFTPRIREARPQIYQTNGGENRSRNLRESKEYWPYFLELKKQCDPSQKIFCLLQSRKACEVNEGAKWSFVQCVWEVFINMLDRFIICPSNELHLGSRCPNNNPDSG